MNHAGKLMAALPFMGGCTSTIVFWSGATEGGALPMGGTMIDFCAIFGAYDKLEWYVRVVTLIDLPLSLAMDAVFLPFSLTLWLAGH
jgi:uncharacterized protein YceK